jgi:outer membrane lipoprotein-sorting protein
MMSPFHMSALLRSRALLVLLTVMPLSGCLFRSRKVEQLPGTFTLKSATQQDLITYINTESARIQSLQATVDIDTTVGGVKKGKVTDYQEIRGYVLARKPAMLRMIGLMPIVRTQAFDMVSDGTQFKLWIPPKNRFVMGRNDIEPHDVAQPLENLRPRDIYDTLLLRSIDPQNEIAVLENETELVSDAKGHKIQRADYVIDVIARNDHGWFLSRKIVFSRTDLLPHRQILYAPSGDVVTNALYENYKEDYGVRYPWEIEIAWPQEEYYITLALVKLDLNRPLADEKFVLEQPAGASVVHLDQPANSAVGQNGSNR